MKLGSAEVNRRNQLSEITYAYRITPYYEPGIPLKCNYKILDYRVSISGIPRSAEGDGPILNENTKRYLRSVRKGSVVTIETRVLNTITNTTKNKNASYTIE